MRPVGVDEAAKLPKGLSHPCRQTVNVNHWQRELEPITNSSAVAKSTHSPLRRSGQTKRPRDGRRRSFPDIQPCQLNPG